MRIGIDMHVVDGLFQGSRTHVIELFYRVAQLCPDIEFFGLLDDVDHFREKFPAYQLPNFHFYHMSHSGPVKRLMFTLPELQKRLKLDLLHTQYIIPLPSYSKTVVTIHDVLFESHPEYFTCFFRLRSRLLMRWAACRSQQVFTVSDYSKSEIISRYGIDKEKLSVIYNGVDFDKFYPGENGVEGLSNRGLESGKYLLTVGRLEPRKNHVTLINAYAQLGSFAPKLVIIGQRDFRFQEIFSEIDRLNLNDRVVIIEDVGDEELPALYRHAQIFIYPSKAEGFGMPPLEAMASGVPVISADNTALTEVIGRAGILVPSLDITALASALDRMLKSPELRSHYANAGLQQAKMFQWQGSAQIIAGIYQQIRFSVANET